MKIQRILAGPAASCALLTGAGPGAASPVAAGTIIHVDDDAPPGGHGLNWATAFISLQSAMDAANPGDVIRVAQGTYEPEDQGIPGDQRSVSFVPPSSVMILGGFAGIGAPDPDLRDVATFVTTLSGDVGFPSDATDNAYQVLRPVNVTGLVVDGFTITGGYADNGPMFRDHGAAVYAENCTSTFRACRFEFNLALEQGGAIHATGGALTLEDCAFIANTAGFGGAVVGGGLELLEISGCTFNVNEATDENAGAVYVLATIANISTSTFTANGAPGPAGGEGSGGAIDIRSGAEVLLTGCVFTGNTAEQGGAVHVHSSLAAFESCQFIDNEAEGPGGAVAAFSDGSTEACGCLFQGNRGERGGGLYAQGGVHALVDCDFEMNTATKLFGGAVSHATLQPITITGCRFTENTAALLGGAIRTGDGTIVDCLFEANWTVGHCGAAVTSAEAEFVGCTFIDNVADIGGALCLLDDNGAEVRGCEFRSNHALSDGGAIATDEASDAVIIESRFLGNTAERDGGAVLNTGDAVPTFVNCAFSGNHAINRGGAIRNNGSAQPAVVNCTVSHNDAGSLGGGICAIGPAMLLANSIVWGNTDSSPFLEATQILLEGTTTIDMHACCVEGLTGSLGGSGNIGSDPGLLDPNGADDVAGTPDDDLQLDPYSPCVDAGDDALVPTAVSTDLDGNPRFQDGDGDTVPTVDIGAHEAPAIPPCLADITDDLVVDVADLVALILAWGPCLDCPADIDANDIVDVGDLVAVIIAWGGCRLE